jgi:hypothetical protein
MDEPAIMPKFLALRNISHKGSLTGLFQSYSPFRLGLARPPCSVFIKSSIYLKHLLPFIHNPNHPGSKIPFQPKLQSYVV